MLHNEIIGKKIKQINKLKAKKLKMFKKHNRIFECKIFLNCPHKLTEIQKHVCDLLDNKNYYDREGNVLIDYKQIIRSFLNERDEKILKFASLVIKSVKLYGVNIIKKIREINEYLIVNQYIDVIHNAVNLEVKKDFINFEIIVIKRETDPMKIII
jgi:hypothetical protein